MPQIHRRVFGKDARALGRRQSTPSTIPRQPVCAIPPPTEDVTAPPRTEILTDSTPIFDSSVEGYAFAYATIDLPFSVSAWGIVTNTLRISSNGNIQFPTQEDGTYAYLYAFDYYQMIQPNVAAQGVSYVARDGNLAIEWRTTSAEGPCAGIDYNHYIAEYGTSTPGVWTVQILEAAGEPTAPVGDTALIQYGPSTARELTLGYGFDGYDPELKAAARAANPVYNGIVLTYDTNAGTVTASS